MLEPGQIACLIWWPAVLLTPPYPLVVISDFVIGITPYYLPVIGRFRNLSYRVDELRARRHSRFHPNFHPNFHPKWACSTIRLMHTPCGIQNLLILEPGHIVMLVSSEPVSYAVGCCFLFLTEHKTNLVSPGIRGETSQRKRRCACGWTKLQRRKTKRTSSPG